MNLPVVEHWPISKLKAYARNPRKNDKAIDGVARSIREFGFLVPIVAQEDGTVVAGHTRLESAKRIGMDTVPVIVASHLSEAQVQAFRIADNRLAQIAGWDPVLLRQEIDELFKKNVDLSILGFREKELDRMLHGSVALGMPNPSLVPDEPDKPASAAGTLWRLGDHLLLCGDCGKMEDMLRVTQNERVDLIHTDPPWNVEAQPRTMNAVTAAQASGKITKVQRMILKQQGVSGTAPTTEKVRPKDRPIENDALSDEQYAYKVSEWFSRMWVPLKEGGSFYLWIGYASLPVWFDAIRQYGSAKYARLIIWLKERTVPNATDFMSEYEPCIYGWKLGAPHTFHGPTNASDVWRAVRVQNKYRLHLTEKPLDLPRTAITYSTKSGEIVLDPFAGSGSTLIACEELGRKCRAIEIDPYYCDVIVRRWEATTGRKAELVTD